MINSNSEERKPYHRQNQFAPAGFQTNSINTIEQQVFNENDIHFLQYIDELKNQVNEEQQTQFQTKRNQKINQIQKNNPLVNSKTQNTDLNKTLSNFINISDLLYENTQTPQNIRNTNTQPKLKSDIKKNVHSQHTNQLDQNLVDKFLFTVTSPNKNRYSQISNQDQNIKEFQQNKQIGQTMPKINELLSYQQQQLKQQQNSNYKQEINIKNNIKKQQGNLQINTQINYDNNEILQQNQNDPQQFLNQLLTMRSQSSTVSRAKRRVKNDNLQFINKQQKIINPQDQILQDQQDAYDLYECNQYTTKQNIQDLSKLRSEQYTFAGIQSKTKMIQNNSFSEKPYNENNFFNQNESPSYQTTKSLLIKQFIHKNSMNINHKHISKKMKEGKTQLYQNKQSQIKKLEGKIQYDNCLDLSINKEDEQSQQTLYYKQNKTPSNMINDNLAQLSISGYSTNNKIRLKSQIQISPNLSNIQNNESNTTKNNLFININNSNLQKQDISLNSQSEQFIQLQRSPINYVSQQQQNNRNQLNKSFDIKQNLSRKLDQDKRNISFDNKFMKERTSYIPLIKKNQNINLIFNKNDNTINVNHNGNNNIQTIMNQNKNFSQQNNMSVLSTIFNQNNIQQSNKTPSQILHSSQNIQNSTVTQNLNSMISGQLKNTLKTHSPNSKIGNSYFQFQQHDNLTKQSVEIPDYSICLSSGLNEDFCKNLLQIETLKKSPWKGNIIQSKKQEKEFILQLLKSKGNKLNNDDVNRISQLRRISPSLFRKSLKVKDVIQNNLMFSVQDINSSSKQKTKDNSSLLPLDQNKSQITNQFQDKNNQCQKIIENNQQNIQKCKTEADNNENNFENEENMLQYKESFKKQQYKLQNQVNSLKISQLQNDTVQKRSQQNQNTSKKQIQDHDNKIQTILKPLNTQINTECKINYSKSTQNKDKTPLQISLSQNNLEVQSSQQYQNEMNTYERIENTEQFQKENHFSQKSKNKIRKDKNTRFIHLCIVSNTKDFLSFLKENQFTISDSRNLSLNSISHSKSRSNSQSPTNYSQPFNISKNTEDNITTQELNQQNVQQINQQIDQQPTQKLKQMQTEQQQNNINYKQFKKQINLETLQQSDSSSFYLKTICIPKQKHLIYMTEISIKYAQHKLFFSNFHTLLQKLNSQENITPNEPYQYIFNSNLSQVTNIFEVNDNIPFLIITKQMLFSSKYNMIEENIHLNVQTPSPGKSRKYHHRGQQSGVSCNTSNVSSPNSSFLNKSSIFTKPESYTNPNALYTTSKNSFRDKIRVQTSSDNTNTHKQFEQFPKDCQQINPETDTNTNKNQISSESNQIIELNQPNDKQENLNEYLNLDINQQDLLSKDGKYENIPITDTIENMHIHQRNLNKQLFDFDALRYSPSKQTRQNSLTKQGIDCNQVSYNHSNSFFMNNLQLKKGMNPKVLQSIYSKISPQAAQDLTLTQQLCISTSNKKNVDNIKFQKLNIMSLFLNKFDIPTQKSLQEQLSNDAFWNHTKNEIELLFLDFLYMVQNQNGFLDKTHIELLEICNLRTRISRIFNEKLYITFQVLQKQYSNIKKIKNDNIIRAIIIQTCSEYADLQYQDFNSIYQVHILWNQFLRFHAMFQENKWNREDKVKFIENVFNPEKEQTIIFDKIKQIIPDMFTNYSFCKKLTNYFESNTCTSKEGQQVITQARFRELICKEQMISTQDIINQIFQQHI